MAGAVVRFRYRAYPTGPQRQALARLFGCCRVVHNDLVGAREQARAEGRLYPNLGELSKALITQAKRTPGRGWLGEVSAAALQQALADADRAYRNFFASVAGGRRGRRVGHPRFATRHGRQSARFAANARFSVSAVHDRRAVVRLPRVGNVPFVLSRPLPSEPSSVTVVREADGRFYVSFVVRTEDPQAEPTGRVCGVDVGLSSFATIVSATTGTGDGERVERVPSPLLLRRRARALARSQRTLSRRQKGSANRAKARRRVAVRHRKVRDARLDHAHKLADRIVDAHDVVCVEDLAVGAMARTTMARSVADQGLGQFLRLVDEKAARRGKTVVRVGRWFPSTQLCSACGARTGPAGREHLHVRRWTCAACGVSHDRDVNAARNLLAEGLRLLAEGGLPVVADGRSETENACGAEVRPPATPGALGVEPGRDENGGASCAA